MLLDGHSERHDGGGRMVFERLKQLTHTTDAGRTDYECKGCEARFEMRRQVCPECGGYRIERVDW